MGKSKKIIILFMMLFLISFNIYATSNNDNYEVGVDYDVGDTSIQGQEKDEEFNLSEENIFNVFENLTSINNYIEEEYTNFFYSFLENSPLYQLQTIAVDTDMSGSCGTNTTYFFDVETGVLTISGTGTIEPYLYQNQMSDFYETVTEVVIENGVIEISLGSFRNFSALTKVTIPESIELIGKNAFMDCSALEVVNYNAINATCIAYNGGTISTVFLRDYSIKELNIGDKVETIPLYLFWTSSNTDNVFNITELVLPESLKRIEDYAFSNFRTLTNIVIPENVEYIGSGAFSGATSLQTVTINSSKATLYDTNATFYRTNVIFYTHDNSSAYYWVESYASGQNNSLCEISDEWTMIREPSFNRLGMKIKTCTICKTTLEEQYIETEMATYTVIIPKTLILDGTNGKATYEVKTKGHISDEDYVYVVPDESFEVKDVQEIKEPIRATINQEKTFFSYDELDETNWNTTKGEINCNLTAGSWKGSFDFIVKIDNLDETVDITQLNFNYLEDGDTMVITKYLGDDETVKIASTYLIDGKEYTVIGLSDYAFANNENIKEVILPNTITSIGNSCFRNCQNLVEVTMPNELTYMGESIFRNCVSLTTINNLSQYSLLPNFTFYNCSSIETIELSESMESIGDYAFYNCSSLRNIPDNGIVETYGKYAFAYCSSIEIIAIPENIVSIGERCFYSCKNASNIIFNTKLTTIPSYAFSHCESVKTLTIPEHIKSLGYGAFQYMYSLETVNFNPTSLSVSSYDSSTNNYTAQFHQSPIKEINIGENVTTIGDAMFADFAKTNTIETLVIPENVKSIGTLTFADISSLTTVDFSNAKSLTFIGDTAFRNANKVVTLTLPENLITIDDYAFNNWSSLETITFNEKLESIGDYAFRHINAEELIFPESLTHIGKHAFRDNTSLKYLYLPKNLTFLGSSAFYGDIALDTIDYACIALTGDGYVSSSGGYYINMFGGASLTNINFIEGVVSIPSCLFYNNDTHVDSAQTTIVVLPSTLNIIGYSNFYNFNKLTTLVIKAHGGTYYGGAFGNIKTKITDVYTDLNENWKTNWGLTNATWHPLSEYVETNGIATMSLEDDVEAVEPTLIVTPIPSVTPIDEITPTSSITPTPTVVPTSSITPTPTSSPIETVTPTPSIVPTTTPDLVEPTPTPTEILVVTSTPSPTLTPSVSPTPTMSSGEVSTPSITITPTIVPTGTGTTPTPSVILDEIEE